MTRGKSKFSLIVLLASTLAFSYACGEKKSDQGKEQTEATDNKAKEPKIVALGDTFDFGKVKQGAKVEHVFRIRNEGTADLKIEKARGS